MYDQPEKGPTTLSGSVGRTSVALHTSERLISEIEDAINGAIPRPEEMPNQCPPGIASQAADNHERILRLNDRLQMMLNGIQGVSVLQTVRTPDLYEAKGAAVGFHVGR